ncbi:MAG: hypothetical protein ABIA21_00015 [Candidatus Aenigmatarchaeota archaeon]
MFSAKLIDLPLLRDSVAAISELIDEAEIVVRGDSIRIVASDRAVVSVVDFFLAKEAFAEYNYEKDMKVGLNLINFLKILKRAAGNDVMELKITEEKFDIQFKGDSVRVFSLPVIDVSRMDLPPIEKLEFPSFFEIKSEILNSGIDDTDLIGDSMIINVQSDKLILRSESETSMAQLELVPNGGMLQSLSSPQASRSRYSLDYLKKIIKAKKLSDIAKVSLGTDYPMKIVFEIPGKARLSFILAPRVED